MKLAYQYKLKPTPEQVAVLEHWLEMLRHQYNYLLAQRFDWWQHNRCPINSCPLTCSIAPPAERPNYYAQKRSLVALKRERPWYKAIHSQVLQDCVKRVEKTFSRFVRGDSSGKRSGRPRFKGKGRYRSLTYPQIKDEQLIGNYIILPKLGTVRYVQHRLLPDGFSVKAATVTHKADGWYLTLSLDNPDVPQLLPVQEPSVLNTVGIDVGLSAFLTTSDGVKVAVPHYYRKAQLRLAKLQRTMARRQKGSKRWEKARQQVAKLHLKVARQRKDFHYKVAHALVGRYQYVAFEKLNIKGLARTRLAKSILDAGWGQFLQIVSRIAANAGGGGLPQNPRGTSIDCSDCGHPVPKTLSERWHSCPSCGAHYDRDHNAGRNIKHRAVGHTASAQEMSGRWVGVTEKPALYASA